MEQREIKFRGLRSDNGGWITGSYHCCKGSVILHSHDYFGKPKERDVVLNNHWILTHNLPSSPGWTISDTYMAFSVIPESVGQFTGKKDKNGVEVYEGDVYHQGDPNIKYVVEWHDCGLRGRQVSNKSTAGISNWQDVIEVIGNRWLNPELLNP